MVEDEIQYIGTRMPPAIVAPAPIRPFPSPQNPVTGITLHVEANGGQPACDMTFYRAETSAVTIGRKSSSDHRFGRGDDGLANAGFACQVVSGRHAKLAFSDSGYVYLIDLSSRHGTHILHPGETVSKMLESEVVTMLSNGDIITFGKTVGKGSFLVHPVTARVELLFGSQSGVASSTSENTRTPVAVLPVDSRARPSSGRFGLYIPSLSSPDGSSDDDSSLKYDHDSDIEEITPPSSGPDRVGCRPCAPSLPSLPAIRGLHAHFFDEPRGDSFPFSSPIDIRRLPAVDRVLSRSHSPMDLSSPTPTPIGAWPSFVAPSPSANNEEDSSSKHSSDESSHDEDDLEVDDAKSSGPLFSQEVISAQSRGPSEMPSPDVGKPSCRQPSEGDSRSPSPPSELDLQGREKEIEKEQDIRDRLMETINHVRHEAAGKRGFYQPRTDGSQQGDELSNLASRVADAENLSSNLDNRLDVTEDHVLSLTDHISKLQDQADALTPVLRDSTAEAIADIKAGVAALNTLVTDIKALHQDMELQNTVNLSARRAMATIGSEALVCCHPPADSSVDAVHITTSRKRKRSEMEADEAASTSFDTVAVQATALSDNTTERPDRKRARKFVSSVMHTAAAVAVGAVATWSALAFS